MLGLATLLCATAAAAADPLKSPACGQAIAALESVRAGTPDTADRRERVHAARSQAARICLGQVDPPARTARPAVAPLQVPPPLIDPPPLPPVAVTPPVSPPAPAWRPPPVVTSCDAGGCWDSDGTRLDRAGPLLTGPRGPCIQQGAVLSCP
ncbi:hypothetical protein [Ramlibacter tataouinensis]|uniref:hypothetical protein n=1 Tax=Ramlibacter tataouinensis TaxID=94132 RepID=UPI00117E52CF|nr:hypothetical protein [Ramlibacter tataouinensis]